MKRTPTEAEVRAAIRAEMMRRNAAVTPEARSAAIRAGEQGYGAEGSPYAAKPLSTPSRTAGRELSRRGKTAQQLADEAAGRPR